MLRCYIFSLLSLFSFYAHAEARCKRPAATLHSIEGKVSWKSSSNKPWLAAQIGQEFCFGDIINVQSQRAALRLRNNTLVRLNEKTLISLLPENQSFWLSIKQGAAHFLTRTPKTFTVKTPYMNAAVEGTEFIVSASSKSNIVSVVEGRVSVSNKYGKVDLTDGTHSSTQATTAPQLINTISLKSAAEWTLYYPPLIAQIDTSKEIKNLLQQEKYQSAIELLEQASDINSLSLKVSLLLASGQTLKAKKAMTQALSISPDSAEILSLQALMDLTEGNRAGALQKTHHLYNLHPQNTTVLLAHAYSLQGNAELAQALTTLKMAADIDPNNPHILARLAELELSNVHIRKAKKAISKALALHPDHSQLNTLAGFISLNQVSTSQASQYFSQAIQHNSINSLSHLGLALTLVQKGQLELGREQMELAVILNPSSSLLRSYLGKTYFERQNYDWSSTQFELAKILDPNDPSPWFYEAHLKMEQNKLPEALTLISTAILKNDNRAIYRSRQQLDSDAAARSANQAAIYQQLGFEQLALNTASQAVVENPNDFASHQALALAYSVVPKAQYIRADEALIAKLYQPIGAKALSVGTGTIGIQSQPWLSPSAIGLNEYSSLFTQRGLTGNLSIFSGSQDTAGYEVQTQLIGQNTSIDLGQYKYQTDGYRLNNYLNEEISEIALHYQTLDNVKLFAQHTSRDQSSGDLMHGIESDFFDNTLTNMSDWSVNELGFIYKINPSNSIIAHLGKSKRKSIESSKFIDLDYTLSTVISDLEDNSQSEIAYQYNSAIIQLQAGFQSSTSDQIGKIEETDDFGTFLTAKSSGYSQKKTYFHLTTPKVYDAKAIIGAARSQQELQNSELALLKSSGNEYRLGLQWDPLNKVRLSLGKWKTISKHPTYFGSIEQTHLFESPVNQTTGFFTGNYNTAFRASWTGSKISSSFQSKVSSQREPMLNLLGTVSTFPIDSRSNTFDFNYIINDSMTIHSRVSKETIDRNEHNPISFSTLAPPVELERELTNLELSTYINFYLSFSLSVDYIDQQEVYDFTERSTTSHVLLSSAQVRIKLPRRLGLIKVEGHNLADEGVSLYQGSTQIVTDKTNPTVSRFPSERSVAISYSTEF